MKAYETLYKRHRHQAPDTAFAHFYPVQQDYDEPFKLVARQTLDGIDAWTFHQDRFKSKHPNTSVPKLKNYLSYTFKRLLDLEALEPGRYFLCSKDGTWITFNTGLQNIHGADLLAIFERYKHRPGQVARPVPDWVFKGCYPPNDRQYRDKFGTDVPDIAWYSVDSRDYVFDTRYRLERDGFDHLFDALRNALVFLMPLTRQSGIISGEHWRICSRRSGETTRWRSPYGMLRNGGCSCSCLSIPPTLQTFRVFLSIAMTRWKATGSKRYSISIRRISQPGSLPGPTRIG